MSKYFKISILLILALSCRQTVNNSTVKTTDTPVNTESTSKLTSVKKEVTTCQVSEITKVIVTSSDDAGQNLSISISQQSGNRQTTLKSNELDFTLGQTPEITAHCYDNQFQIQYLEQIGNSYYVTRHVFELDNVSNDFVWTKVYRTEATRQGFSIWATFLSSKENFNDYKGIEGELSLQTVYEFTGFQEHKEPSIDDFYNSVKSNKDASNIKQLALIGDQYVLGYLLENIPVEKANLSKYNDIAYYLEQAKLYNASILVLEKIVKNFPERTVAYINLGDAYKGLENMEKAKENYGKYIELMKMDSKEDKIPQRIWDNIK